MTRETDPATRRQAKNTGQVSSQSARFIEAAREAGCSEDEAKIRENIRRIAKPPKAYTRGEKA